MEALHFQQESKAVELKLHDLDNWIGLPCTRQPHDALPLRLGRISALRRPRKEEYCSRGRRKSAQPFAGQSLVRAGAADRDRCKHRADLDASATESRDQNDIHPYGFSPFQDILAGENPPKLCRVLTHEALDKSRQKQ